MKHMSFERLQVGLTCLILSKLEGVGFWGLLWCALGGLCLVLGLVETWQQRRSSQWTKRRP